MTVEDDHYPLPYVTDMSREALEAEVAGHRAAYQVVVDDLHRMQAENARLESLVVWLQEELRRLRG